MHENNVHSLKNRALAIMNSIWYMPNTPQMWATLVSSPGKKTHSKKLCSDVV